MQKDDPASSWEAFLSSVGILRVKRCSNCNAAVFVILGFLPITRLRFRLVNEFIFWITLLLLVLVLGLVLAETLTN